MARRVEVSGGRERGRQRLSWMDGVKWPWVTEEWRWRLLDNARKIRKSGGCNNSVFLLGPLFFRTTLPCSGGYHMERGGMPLHDAIEINCKKGQLMKIKAQMSSILAKGCMLMIVCYLTWHDYPSLVEGENHDILLLLLFYYSIVKRIIIIYHDFLPPSRRGSHVQSDNTHNHKTYAP